MVRPQRRDEKEEKGKASKKHIYIYTIFLVPQSWPKNLAHSGNEAIGRSELWFLFPVLGTFLVRGQLWGM